MTKKEAAKLLELIQLAYPYAHRDKDTKWKQATINMWAASFPEVPYCLMERCFDDHRMRSKYPPTVAELAEQLRTIHREAEQAMYLHRQLGNRQLEQHFQNLMHSSQITEKTLLPSLPEQPLLPRG